MQTPSLFERLGGSPGIERIVDEVASRHLENPLPRDGERRTADQTRKDVLAIAWALKGDIIHV